MNKLNKDRRKELKRLWKNATQQNDAEAQFQLGWMYEIGNQVQQNKEKAFYWCEKSANQNHRKSLCQLAYLYYKGNSIKQNTSKAIALYSRAALLGDHKSLFNLGLHYLHGDGVPQNHSKAIKFYRRSAKLGNLGAMNDLGVLLLDMEKDKQEAISLITDAAVWGNSTAQFNLAMIYLYGQDIVEQDLSEAEYWLTQAVENGDKDAQVYLDVWFGS